MKKLLKWMGILAAVAAVLGIAACITLKMMFPADKVKTLVQHYAQKSLQREVTFSDISFNLIGVTLNDVAISEAHTFENGAFVEADQVVLKVALLPLFKKEVNISTIGLKALKINITKNADGTFNFDDLLTDTTAAQPAYSTADAEEDETLPFGIMAEDFFIKNATVVYKDLQANQELTFSNINIAVNDFDVAQPFKSKLELQAAYRQADQNISLPLKGQLAIDLANLNLSKAYVTLNSLTTQYQGIVASFKGGVKNFEQPVVNVQGDLTGISNTSLADFAPDLPHFVLPPLHLQADANIDLENSTANLTQAKMTLADSMINAAGTIGWAEPNPTYNIQSKLALHLAQIAAMSQLLGGYGMGGNIQGQLTATDKNEGQDVRGTIQLDQISVKYPPVEITQLKGDIKLASLQHISSSNITGKLNGENFNTSFTYKDLGNILDLALDIDLSKLKLASFDTASASSSTEQADTKTETSTNSAAETLFNVKAKLNIGEIEIPYLLSKGASLNVDLKKASASLQQADGTVSFELKEGAITDVLNNITGNKIVKIILLPFSLVNKVTSKLGIALFPKNEQAGQIKFTSGSGTYGFTKGLMQIQETHFNSAISDMTASGQINFKTEAINMKVKATVLTSQTPVIIKIGGTVSEPSGKLDITKTAVSLVEGILSYKTPGKVANSTVHTAGKVAGSTVHTASKTGKAVAHGGSEAVHATVNTAASAVKNIGGLFKKKSTAEEETK